MSRSTFAAGCLLLALSPVAVASAQTPQGRPAAATSSSTTRFHIGGSLTGSFGHDQWLTPAVRASFQISPRVGLDVDMGAAINSNDSVRRAPRGFTSAFQIRIGSRRDERGDSRYFVIGSRTIRDAYPHDEFPADVYALPYFAAGMDRHLPNGVRGAGEIGVTGGLNGMVLLFSFCVQFGRR